MTGPKLPASMMVGILALLTIPLMFSCSDDPTNIAPPVDPVGTGTIDPHNNQDVLLSTVMLGEPYDGGIEVWAVNLELPSDSMATFDLVLVNKTNLEVFPPIHFVITQIRPNVVTLLNPDGVTPDRHPYFDFSDQLGDDGKLGPGERTGSVELQFGMPEPMAFSMGFRILVGEIGRKGAIGGVVFRDYNEDGIWDSEREPGVPEFPVELRPTWTSNQRSIIVRTDRLGRYLFDELEAGVYQVTALAAPGGKITSENPLLITLVDLHDGTVAKYLRAHFGLGMLVPPVERVFGPVDVGPWSQNGTEIDTTFVVLDPEPSRPYLYYLRIEPPITFRAVPMWLDEAEVWLNDERIFSFKCPGDSLCPPVAVRPLIERGIKIEGENRFRARVIGNENLMLFMAIEREIPR